MSKKREATAFAIGLLAAVLATAPAVAHAQFGGIFSAILSTITGPIGSALSSINNIQREVLQTEQQVLWPLSLIHQAQNYITTIKASYRGWMNNVFAIRINSASLPIPRNLESSIFERSANADREFQPDLHQHLWSTAGNGSGAHAEFAADGHRRRHSQRRYGTVNGRRPGDGDHAPDGAAHRRREPDDSARNSGHGGCGSEDGGTCQHGNAAQTACL